MDLNKLSRTLSKQRGPQVLRPTTSKFSYMPISYQGFGATAILVMVLILAAAQGINYLRDRFHHK
jgi:hypothetical protein